MISYQKIGNKINKYNVEFNREELEKLNYDIIDNCSEVVHIELSRSNPSLLAALCEESDNSEIKNYKEKEEIIQDQKFYIYSYDKYIYPELSRQIKKLLNKDLNAINNILDTNFIYKSINKKLEYLNKEMNESEDLETLEKLRKNMNKLKKEKEKLDYYYNKVKNIIKVELVQTMNVDKINAVSEFLDIDLIPFSTNDKVSNNVKNQIKNLSKLNN